MKVTTITPKQFLDGGPFADAAREMLRKTPRPKFRLELRVTPNTHRLVPSQRKGSR